MDDKLKTLFLKKLKDSPSSVREALRAGLVTPEDLDPRNRVHIGCALSWAPEKDVKIPVAFIEHADLDDLVRIASKNCLGKSDPMESEARARILRLLQAPDKDDKLLGKLALEWRCSQPDEKWPQEWQTLIEARASDPWAVPAVTWENVRRRLSKDVEARIVSARAKAKAKKTMELVKSGMRASVKSRDPLLQSIADNDHRRMGGLNLQEIPLERWKKAEAAWVASESDEVKARLLQVPWSLVAPHAKLALEAGVAANVKHAGEMPQWPVPQEVFWSLSADARRFWLLLATQINACSEKACVKIEPPFDLDKLKTELTLDALSDAESGAILEWLGWLAKWRRFQEYGKVGTKKLGEQERKVAAAVLAGSGLLRWGSRGVEILANSESKNAAAEIRAFMSWCFDQSPERQGMIARALEDVDDFKTTMKLMFCVETEGPTNFAV